MQRKLFNNVTGNGLQLGTINSMDDTTGPATAPGEEHVGWLDQLLAGGLTPDFWTQAGISAFTLIVLCVLYLLIGRGLRAMLDDKPRYLFLFQRVFRWVYIPFATLLLLQQLGFQLGSLWTVVSTTLAMVAIGFVAVWSVLSNVLATFLIIGTRLFAVDDVVEVLEPTAKDGTIKGRVHDLNLFFTTILHEPVDGVGQIWTKVPNNTFFQKAIRVRIGGAQLQDEVDAATSGNQSHVDIDEDAAAVTT